MPLQQTFQILSIVYSEVPNAIVAQIIYILVQIPSLPFVPPFRKLTTSLQLQQHSTVLMVNFKQLLNNVNCSRNLIEKNYKSLYPNQFQKDTLIQLLNNTNSNTDNLHFLKELYQQKWMQQTEFFLSCTLLLSGTVNTYETLICSSFG